MKESAVVIICTPETPPGENQNVKHNLKVFKKIIPAIARFAAKSVLLIVTRPADVMSYIAWKLSGFPSNRVLGIGTLIDCARLQDFVSRRLNVARSSVSCMTIGSQGDMAGTYYPPSPYFFPLSSPSPSFRSSPLVEHLRGRNEASGHKFEDRGAGRSREVVRNRGEREERVSDRRYSGKREEEWSKLIFALVFRGKELEEKKGSCCWGVAISTTEIVDAIVRNTKVVLPASTHILVSRERKIFFILPSFIRLSFSTELRPRHGQGRVHVRALRDRPRGRLLHRATKIKRAGEGRGADVRRQHSKHFAGVGHPSGEQQRGGAMSERERERGKGRASGNCTAILEGVLIDNERAHLATGSSLYIDICICIYARSVYNK